MRAVRELCDCPLRADGDSPDGHIRSAQLRSPYTRLDHGARCNRPQLRRGLRRATAMIISPFDEQINCGATERRTPRDGQGEVLYVLAGIWKSCEASHSSRSEILGAAAATPAPHQVNCQRGATLPASRACGSKISIRAHRITDPAVFICPLEDARLGAQLRVVNCHDLRICREGIRCADDARQHSFVERAGVDAVKP